MLRKIVKETFPPYEKTKVNNSGNCYFLGKQLKTKNVLKFPNYNISEG